MLSVIIWSRVAVLHWCHRCAVNASVITAPANMAHSQKRQSGITGEELSVLILNPDTVSTKELFFKISFYIYIYFISPPFFSQYRQRKKASKKSFLSIFYNSYCVFIAAPFIITFDILYALPKRNFPLA